MTTWASLFDRSERIIDRRGHSDDESSGDTDETATDVESSDGMENGGLHVETIRQELSRIRATGVETDDDESETVTGDNWDSVDSSEDNDEYGEDNGE